MIISEKVQQIDAKYEKIDSASSFRGFDKWSKRMLSMERLIRPT